MQKATRGIRMIVMPSTRSSPWFHYLCGRHPERLGWLIGPAAWSKSKLRHWIPYACDNDAFSAYTNQTPWQAEPFLKMLKRAQAEPISPMWVLAPDVVGNREQTLEKWDQWATIIEDHGLTPAFAVQDGMTEQDIPRNAKVIFIGGTTRWKWTNAKRFCRAHPHVHIGRVNTIDRLNFCRQIGAKSVDGTGWFRGRDERGKMERLADWLAGHPQAQGSLDTILQQL